MGTDWEQMKKQKDPSPKRKKLGHSKRVHAEPSRWLHEPFNFQNCLSPLYLAWANISRGHKRTVGHTIPSMQLEAICTLPYEWTSL